MHELSEGGDPPRPSLLLKGSWSRTTLRREAGAEGQEGSVMDVVMFLGWPLAQKLKDLKDVGLDLERLPYFDMAAEICMASELHQVWVGLRMPTLTC